MNRLNEVLKIYGGYKTLHHFRSTKRRQCDAALKAAGELRSGCAYTPCHREIGKAIDLLEKARALMTVKSWGR